MSSLVGEMTKCLRCVLCQDKKAQDCRMYRGSVEGAEVEDEKDLNIEKSNCGRILVCLLYQTQIFACTVHFYTVLLIFIYIRMNIFAFRFF